MSEQTPEPQLQQQEPTPIPADWKVWPALQGQVKKPVVYKNAILATRDGSLVINVNASVICYAPGFWAKAEQE